MTAAWTSPARPWPGWRADKYPRLEVGLLKTWMAGNIVPEVIKLNGVTPASEPESHRLLSETPGQARSDNIR
jgi:hypothetical protein